MPYSPQFTLYDNQAQAQAVANAYNTNLPETTQCYAYPVPLYAVFIIPTELAADLENADLAKKIWFAETCRTVLADPKTTDFNASFLEAYNKAYPKP